MNLIKVGDRIINLDNVTNVVKVFDGVSKFRLFLYSILDGGGMIVLHGDEALMLWTYLSGAAVLTYKNEDEK